VVDVFESGLVAQTSAADQPRKLTIVLLVPLRVDEVGDYLIGGQFYVPSSGIEVIPVDSSAG
jgi:hypothetical protein